MQLRVNLPAPRPDQRSDLFFGQRLYIAAHKVATERRVPIPRLARRHQTAVAGILAGQQALNLIPHHPPFRHLHDLIQAIQQDQTTPTAAQQALEEVFRRVEVLVTRPQEPQQKRTQRSRVRRVIAVDPLALLAIDLPEAQRGQQWNRQGRAGLRWLEAHVQRLPKQCRGQRRSNKGQIRRLARPSFPDDGDTVAEGEQVGHIQRRRRFGSFSRDGHFTTPAPLDGLAARFYRRAMLYTQRGVDGGEGLIQRTGLLEVLQAVQARAPIFPAHPAQIIGEHLRKLVFGQP